MKITATPYTNKAGKLVSAVSVVQTVYNLNLNLLRFACQELDANGVVLETVVISLSGTDVTTFFATTATGTLWTLLEASLFTTVVKHFNLVNPVVS